jgi:hypothetical protein
MRRTTEAWCPECGSSKVRRIGGSEAFDGAAHRVMPPSRARPGTNAYDCTDGCSEEITSGAAGRGVEPCPGARR